MIFLVRLGKAGKKYILKTWITAELSNSTSMGNKYIENYWNTRKENFTALFLFTMLGENGDSWQGFPVCSVVKNLPASARDAGEVGFIHGSPRSSGEGNGHPFNIFLWGHKELGKTERLSIHTHNNWHFAIHGHISYDQNL